MEYILYIRVAEVVNQEKLAEEEKKCYTKEGLDKDSYIVSVGGYLLEQPL